VFSHDRIAQITVLIVERNKMLKKNSDEPKKAIAKRKPKSCLIKEKSFLDGTEKDMVTPMSFAGFPTCFNFLRIPVIEKKNTDQICHLKGQNNQ
jgi:hypothetical protein